MYMSECDKVEQAQWIAKVIGGVTYKHEYDPSMDTGEYFLMVTPRGWHTYHMTICEKTDGGYTYSDDPTVSYNVTVVMNNLGWKWKKKDLTRFDIPTYIIEIPEED